MDFLKMYTLATRNAFIRISATVSPIYLYIHIQHIAANQRRKFVCMQLNCSRVFYIYFIQFALQYNTLIRFELIAAHKNRRQSRQYLLAHNHRTHEKGINDKMQIYINREEVKK